MVCAVLIPMDVRLPAPGQPALVWRRRAARAGSVNLEIVVLCAAVALAAVASLGMFSDTTTTSMACVAERLRGLATGAADAAACKTSPAGALAQADVPVHTAAHTSVKRVDHERQAASGNTTTARATARWLPLPGLTKTIAEHFTAQGVSAEAAASPFGLGVEVMGGPVADRLKALGMRMVVDFSGAELGPDGRKRIGPTVVLTPDAWTRLRNDPDGVSQWARGLPPGVHPVAGLDAATYRTNLDAAYAVFNQVLDDFEREDDPDTRQALVTARWPEISAALGGLHITGVSRNGPLFSLTGMLSGDCQAEHGLPDRFCAAGNLLKQYPDTSVTVVPAFADNTAGHYRPGTGRVTTGLMQFLDMLGGSTAISVHEFVHAQEDRYRHQSFAYQGRQYAPATATRISVAYRSGHTLGEIPAFLEGARKALLQMKAVGPGKPPLMGSGSAQEVFFSVHFAKQLIAPALQTTEAALLALRSQWHRNMPNKGRLRTPGEQNALDPADFSGGTHADTYWDGQDPMAIEFGLHTADGRTTLNAIIRYGDEIRRGAVFRVPDGFTLESAPDYFERHLTTQYHQFHADWALATAMQAEAEALVGDDPRLDTGLPPLGPFEAGEEVAETPIDVPLVKIKNTNDPISLNTLRSAVRIAQLRLAHAKEATATGPAHQQYLWRRARFAAQQVRAKLERVLATNAAISAMVRRDTAHRYFDDSKPVVVSGFRFAEDLGQAIDTLHLQLDGRRLTVEAKTFNDTVRRMVYKMPDGFALSRNDPPPAEFLDAIGAQTPRFLAYLSVIEEIDRELAEAGDPRRHAPR